MRHEPIEVSKAAARCGLRVTLVPSRGGNVLRSQTKAGATAVIDEAFAEFPSPSPSSASLVSNIASQLRALDMQREQLAHLLRSVESANISG